MSDPAAGPSIDAPTESHARITVAEWMLLLATVVWGMSFALAKDAGEAINAAAGVDKHTLGPILTLAMRFTIAAGLMLLILPAARRGWTRRHVLDSLLTGGLLWAGITLQHVALDYTIEAVAAFLTSCAVIFVPVLMLALFGQRPAPAAYIGVAVALPGIWLMSGGDESATSWSLDFGVWMGLLAALLHAGHLIAVGKLSQRVGALRICVGQFAVVGLASWAIVPLSAMNVAQFDFNVFRGSRLWIDLGLLLAGPTFISFGLMARFQPLVSPVRAVMIYLFEPIAAAAFAWMWTGRTMTWWIVAGGALVLIANVIVEVMPVATARGRSRAVTAKSAA